jgi:hypothetical protein
MSDKIRVGVIYGSIRPGRFCDVVVKWSVECIIAQDRFLVDVIDPGPQAHVNRPTTHPSCRHKSGSPQRKRSLWLLLSTTMVILRL